MNHSGKVDQDDIMRARIVLLASGRRTPREEVDAYRVLAQVSPVSYLPRLVKALQSLSYGSGYGSGQRHAACLAPHAPCRQRRAGRRPRRMGLHP